MASNEAPQQKQAAETPWYKMKMVVTMATLLMSAIMTMLVIIGSYVGAANYGNRAEQQIKAAWKNNQNVLGQYSLKVKEAAQVPEMYRDDLQKVVTDAIQARYGEGGSKAIMQWLTEAQIPFDSSLYQKIQQITESGRNEFRAEQTKLIDIKRSYETNLGYVWTGFWLARAGYPKINLDDYNVVLAEDTEAIFKKGTAAPIKLR